VQRRTRGSASLPAPAERLGPIISTVHTNDSIVPHTNKITGGITGGYPETQQIGVLGMKTFGGANGVILQSKTVEPLECLHYSLDLPTSVVITGIDNEQVLDQAFNAVKTLLSWNAAFERRSECR
jgi:hypothetical protein